MQATTPIRLMLVDDHSVMREGLANLLAASGRFAVVAEADDGPTAIQLWRTSNADICILDLSMRGMDGIETLRQLRAVDPDARVLMLSSSDAAQDVARALAEGANGYVTKTVSHDDLFAAIHDVHAGGRPIAGQMAPRPEAAAAGIALTPREAEVLDLLREGFTNTDIARLLGITTHTVKLHVAGLLAKLGAADRTQAVARAFDLGLLTTTAPRRSG
jgi:DNA-binding NarL/FixJ family response regulator